MKKLVILFFLILVGRLGLAQATGKLVVEVNGLRNDKGEVLISLFKGKDGFPGKADKAVQKAKAIITGKKAVITFNNVPPGEYALSLMHDEDGDGKLATNMLGIPKEGYAASNNAKNSFGPPKYEDAKFNLEGSEKKLQVNMNY
ncbi:MAG: DUF2141 domain-containing protein [Bernardetiaceae bacterium]|nr:DUF2141 domain-containing protein [Bernardetiaceae bacterium]